ncbi:MAG: DUF2497 domain-containing protein [Alphaproteobacteria bacterium]|nr:DUF2497 domain-containing protein [Alphaproteobacteria bacterium]
MTEQNEPSMEAILASIRNILAEDEEESSGNPAEKEAPAEPQKNAEPEKSAEQQETPSANAEQQEDASSSETEEPEESFNITEKDSSSDELPADETAEKVMDLTADMIVSTPSEEEEEDDFKPEPVIPQEPMKEETLTDLIKETAERQIQDDMLLAEPTVMAATESLSHLRDIAAEKQLSLGDGTLTIEAIVRETLKPYLKEWLDAHLPEIVERVVRKEVAHIMDRLDLK